MALHSIVGRFKTCLVVAIVTACGGNVGVGGSSAGANTGAAQSNSGGAIANGASNGGGNLNTGGGRASGGTIAAGGGLAIVGGSGAGSCVPTKTFADCRAAGYNCDSIQDGCGNLISCGTCTAPDICGGGGIAYQCGSDQPGCVNFCTRVPSCATGTDTVLHGTVWSPAGNPAIDPSRGEVPLPIPNALVYIPNGSTTPPYGLSKFTDGVPGGCDCSVQIPPPLVSTTSRVDGSFDVQGVPARVDIPLVIQLGKWRRVVTIPGSQAPACAGQVELRADQTRLPRRQAEQDPMDSIPLMAVATGADDALECVLRKMGVEDSQFSNGEDSGNGRIRFYRQTATPGAPGASCTNGGGSCLGITPSYTNLVASQASVDRYDALLFPCNGAAHDESTQHKTFILDNASNSTAYVNKGGRAFFTHFSYAWLYNQPPSIALPWPSTTTTSLVDTQWDTAYGQIDTSFARAAIFEQWLSLFNVNALTNVTPFPYVTLTEVRRDLANPNTWPYYPSGNLLYAQRWLFHGMFMTPADNGVTTGSNHVPDSIQHLTFDTPYGDPYNTIQCGRVVFSSFHVTSASLSSNACVVKTGEAWDASSCSFPAECGSTMANQEKILAYMLFVMTGNVCSIDTCVPLTCAQQGVVSGAASDGCGRTLDCGIYLGCPQISCEQSCANQGASCVSAQDWKYVVACPQPDGCGATQTCFCLPA